MRDSVVRGIDRVDPFKDFHHGLLGLAIAKNIIDGLGGAISVESRVGHGTAMRIELPRRPSVEVESVE